MLTIVTGNLVLPVPFLAMVESMPLNRVAEGRLPPQARLDGQSLQIITPRWRTISIGGPRGNEVKL
jgi:hypothetical protein